MGVSRAQKLKMNALKCPKMSWYHHYVSIDKNHWTRWGNQKSQHNNIQISEIRITVQRWWLEAWNETEAKLNESFRASQRVSTKHHRDGFSFWLYRDAGTPKILVGSSLISLGHNLPPWLEKGWLICKNWWEPIPTTPIRSGGPDIPYSMLCNKST